MLGFDKLMVATDDIIWCLVWINLIVAADNIIIWCLVFINLVLATDTALFGAGI